jgi:hypothetical protein
MVLSMSRPWKHPKTGIYYYRKVVPKAMRKLVGLVEVRQTLGTKDPREAALRHTQVAATVAAEWEALRRGPKPLTAREASALAGLWYKWLIPIFEKDVGEDPEGWMMMSENLSEVRERYIDPTSPAAGRWSLPDRTGSAQCVLRGEGHPPIPSPIPCLPIRCRD